MWYDLFWASKFTATGTAGYKKFSIWNFWLFSCWDWFSLVPVSRWVREKGRIEGKGRKTSRASSDTIIVPKAGITDYCVTDCGSGRSPERLRLRTSATNQKETGTRRSMPASYNGLQLYLTVSKGSTAVSYIFPEKYGCILQCHRGV